jgi:hypothetical protein
MLKFVAIGAVVGFLLAYFVLSSASESPAVPAAPVAPPPVAVPLKRPENMDQLMKLQPLPPGMPPLGRLGSLDAGAR